MAELEAPVTAVVPVREPAAAVTEAAAQSEAPLKEATKPATQITAPITKATKPATQITAPITKATKPATQITAPIKEATKPATSIVAPIKATVKPVIESTAPFVGPAFAPTTELVKPIEESVVQPSTEKLVEAAGEPAREVVSTVAPVIRAEPPALREGGSQRQPVAPLAAVQPLVPEAVEPVDEPLAPLSAAVTEVHEPLGPPVALAVQAVDPVGREVNPVTEIATLVTEPRTPVAEASVPVVGTGSPTVEPLTPDTGLVAPALESPALLLAPVANDLVSPITDETPVAPVNEPASAVTAPSPIATTVLEALQSETSRREAPTATDQQLLQMPTVAPGRSGAFMADAAGSRDHHSATVPVAAQTSPAPAEVPEPPTSPVALAASALASGPSTVFFIALVLALSFAVAQRYRRLLVPPAASRPVLFVSLLERPG